MGVSKEFYLGPYIEFTFDPIEHKVDRCLKVESARRAMCPIKGDENPGGFCQGCGLDLRNEGRFQTCMRRPDIYAMTNGSLIKVPGEGGNDFEIVRPNYTSIPNGRDFEAGCGDSAEITHELIETEIAWMKKRYAEEIAEFERAFEEVEIKWGAFVYWE